MHSLFTTLRLAHTRLPNRLVLGALPSGLAVADGGFTNQLELYYELRAQGGVGLVVLEPLYVLPPRDDITNHIGLYYDQQMAGLARCIRGIRAYGATVLVMLDQPLWLAHATDAELAAIGEAFLAAAQRAGAAGADGVMFSAADGGPFEQLISPLQNQRSAPYGGSVGGRLKLLLDLVAALRRNSQLVVGVRLNVEEFTPGGIDLKESRAMASLLTVAGANLFEVCAKKPQGALVAQFPGWQVPLAEGIKSVVDVPVMVGGLLDNPLLADSVIRERSADLIAVSERVHREPDWPQHTRAMLDAQRASIDGESR